jgi:hypothetical protein
VGQALLWRLQDPLNRRVAVVTSMSSLGKVNYADDKNYNLLYFMVFSWTLEEYLQAIECEELLRSVLFFLNTGQDLTNQEMVEEKFLIAGGCAQYMFGMLASDVRRSLNNAISSLESYPSSNILSEGQRSGELINRLFNRYQNVVGKTFTTFVSQFAETEIALLKGPQAVKELFRLIRKFASGSNASNMFEAAFFVRMRSDGISLKCINGTQITLSSAEFEDYHLKMELITCKGRQLWLRPVTDYQIGFDAVYIDKDAKFARFFQLARGATHSFKMDGCNVLLSKLNDCTVEVVEFCFVVRGKLLHSFKISGGKKTTGRGWLSGYRVAGKEKE